LPGAATPGRWPESTSRRACSGPREPEARLLAGDAARLPLRDAASDVTLAMHMLYHVPEPADVVGELRRVTRPGGRVVIGLNAHGHLGELRALINAELSAAGQPHVVRDRIWIEDAEVMLRRAFGSVTRHDLAGTLRLPDPRPAADYVRSLGVARQPADLELLVAAVTSGMDFGADGVFTVTTHCGWLICS